jgi:pimeloyl-ACP methyl ester carboxylesterase
VSEGFVSVNGVRLWWEQRGDPAGVPILMVNGAGGSAISWRPELLNGLVAEGRRVVRFDNRDIGLSSHIHYAVAPYTLDDMATDTVELLDALAVSNVHLVGSSLGGMISQVVSVRHPERVLSLTLLSTSPGPDERLSPPDPRLVEILTRVTNTPEDAMQCVLELFRALTGSRFSFDAAYYRQRVIADAARGTNLNSAHVRVALKARSRLDALMGLQLRTLIVHGSEDPVIPFDHAEAMAKAIPGSKLVRWEGVGHEMPIQMIPELVGAIIDHNGAMQQA